MAWLSGGLTRHALRDVVDSAEVSKYLDTLCRFRFRAVVARR